MEDEVLILQSIYSEIQVVSHDCIFVPLGSILQQRIQLDRNPIPVICPSLETSLFALLNPNTQCYYIYWFGVDQLDACNPAFFSLASSLKVEQGTGKQVSEMLKIVKERISTFHTQMRQQCLDHPLVYLKYSQIEQISSLISNLEQDSWLFNVVEVLLDFFARNEIIDLYFVHIEESTTPPSFKDDEPNQPEFMIDAQPASSLIDIFHGEPITDRKSTFIAHMAFVHCKSDVDEFLQTLSRMPRLQRSTHTIVAFRYNRIVPGVGNCQQERYVLDEDFDDDGERAAGHRMLHLMQSMGVLNVAVVVSRFYGGIKLGPDRFRLINNCAKKLLEIHYNS
jgi:hypothetical protein